MSQSESVCSTTCDPVVFLIWVVGGHSADRPQLLQIIDTIDSAAQPNECVTIIKLSDVIKLRLKK